MRHPYRTGAFNAALIESARLGWSSYYWGGLLLLITSACTGQILDSSGAEAGGLPTDSTATAGTSAGGTDPRGGSGRGGMPSSSAQGGAGSSSTSANGSGGSAIPAAEGGSTTASPECNSPKPGRSPLRRLTTREYNNTVRDLLGDTTNPGDLLPPQVDSKENWFGNDADFQSVPDTLVEKYQTISEGIAARATASVAALGRLHACAGKTLAGSEEEGCARSIAESITPRVYRRAVTKADADDLVALYRSVRGLSPTVSFASGVAAMLEAALQSPEFLYRVETGGVPMGESRLRRVTGHEMATRLSYLLWQTMPDSTLFSAAQAGRLDSPEGVLAEARRLLEDPRSRATVAFFFDNFMPIADLAGLARDASLFPTWSSRVGLAMREEIQRVIEHEVFENTQSSGPHAVGSWPALLTAPYTFVNEELFRVYGASTFAAGNSVSGADFQKVDLNTGQRLGLLTLGGVMAGSTTSNRTNPVLRGIFVINKVMCMNLELPTGLTPPEIDPYSGKTARQRVAKHSQDAFCAACHRVIDPVGLPFENYDPIGGFRASEKWTDPTSNVTYDTPIDASGAVPGVEGLASNAVELARKLATSELVQNCFASHWMHFAYGRSLDEEDDCNTSSVRGAFKASDYNIKKLLLALTQTDAFLYRSAD